MEYQNIHSEELLKKLIDIQYRLLSRQELPTIMGEEAFFFLQYANADYIAVSFFQKEKIDEMECKLGDDHGLLTLLKKLQIKSSIIYTYNKSIEKPFKLMSKDDFCHLFQFGDDNCSKVKKMLTKKYILLYPIYHGQDHNIGFIFMILNTSEELDKSIEICNFLEIIIAPFYDIETGTFSQLCIHENHRFENLSQREREIAELLLHGLTYDEIKERTGLSINTVKTHIKHIYQKYNISNRNDFYNHFLVR